MVVYLKKKVMIFPQLLVGLVSNLEYKFANQLEPLFQFALYSNQHI